MLIKSLKNRLLPILLGLFIAVLSAKVTGLLDRFWEHYTQGLYSLEIVSIKNYEGKVYPKDKYLGHYFFAKIRFSKPWYTSSTEIYPKALRIVKTNNPAELIDEYNIVPIIDPKKIYIPRVETLPNNIHAISSSDGLTTVICNSSDQIGEKMEGDSHTMETLYDINNNMVSLPFKLKRGDEAVKVLLFKLKGDKPKQIAFGNPNLSYQIIGTNIKTKLHQFTWYFLFDQFKDSNTPLYIFLYKIKNSIQHEAFKKAYNRLTNTKYHKVSMHIQEICKGILEIYLDNTAIGNEIIKNNFPFLNQNEKIEIMPLIIWANMNKKNVEYIETYVKDALDIAPNYILFHDIKAQHLINLGKWKEALEIYNNLTPTLIISPEDYYPLLITKGILLFATSLLKPSDRNLSNYYLSNYYLLENVDKLKPKKHKRLINCIYFVVGANFFYEEKIEKAKDFFDKIDPNSYYDRYAKKLLKNNKLEGIVYFVYR